MNRTRETIFMDIGILTGLALSGPAVQAATSITATLSSQPIYVDEQQVSITAYSIGGNNYIRLRDIGKAVDFSVTYDAATNSVYNNSTQPYSGGNPRRTVRPHRGKRPGRLASPLQAVSSRLHMVRTLPLYQQRALLQRHELRRLGHPVFGCRVW